MRFAVASEQRPSVWAAQGSRPLGLVSDLCFACLKVIAWGMVTASCVVACFALFFLMLGDFSFARFVGHLDNFTARYLAADAARRALFEGQLGFVCFTLFALVGFFRRHSLFPLIIRTEETQHGNI